MPTLHTFKSNQICFAQNTAHLASGKIS